MEDRKLWPFVQFMKPRIHKAQFRSFYGLVYSQKQIYRACAELLENKCILSVRSYDPNDDATCL